MTIDLAAASDFMAAHARMLDRRRFQLLFGEAEPDAVLAAVDAYRNVDGGYGWGLEPDLRAVESQPGGALHAFEVFEELAPVVASQAVALCDWLREVSLADGGLPFALPVANPTACAPFWAEADASASSLHITAAVVGQAHRVARHDRAVAAHPWLPAATDYCLDGIARLTEPGHAIEFMYVLQLLDAVHDIRAEAPAELTRVAAFLPANGTMHVGGGLEDEFLGPLDFSPTPYAALRAHVAADAIVADLDRLAGLQQDDGGWVVDFTSYSPAAGLEWRGYATVRALSILRRNGRLPVT
jgi:hypothetical protein